MDPDPSPSATYGSDSPDILQRQGSPQPETSNFYNNNNNNINSYETTFGHYPYLESQHQQPNLQRTIQFYPNNSDNIYDEQGNLSMLQMEITRVDNCNFEKVKNNHEFVFYIKNQFVFTVRISNKVGPNFVFVNNCWFPIKYFKITYYAVKEESQNSVIFLMTGGRTVESRIPAKPFKVDYDNMEFFEHKFKKLYLSESTDGNGQKQEQRYFLFVVNLLAIFDTDSGEQDILVKSYHSDKFIVRPQNKKEYEKTQAKRNAELNAIQQMTGNPKKCWKCENGVISTMNKVVIGGTEPLDENCGLTVLTNIIAAGYHLTFSDGRLKFDIKDLKNALENVRRLRPVEFTYIEEFAKKMNIENPRRFGFIAQEVREVLEDAVHQVGDYLAVDEKRICVEGIAATIELAQRTDDMQRQIRALAEKVQTILAKGYEKKVMRESMASGLHKIHKSSKSLGKWSFRLAIILIMCIIALALLSITFLNYVELRVRYGSPNASWPLNYDPNPRPANMILPIERLWDLQKNLSALSPKCRGGHCHSYCVHGNSTLQSNSIKNARKGLKKPSKLENHVHSLLKTDYFISLPEFNAILDSRYCIGQSCIANRGKFHLYVPLSHFIPSTSMRIRFSLSNGKIVEGCGIMTDFKNNMGENTLLNTKSMKIRQIDDVTFELPVGHLSQSAFYFRVGFSTDICKLPKNSYGFDEVVVHFYRKC